MTTSSKSILSRILKLNFWLKIATSVKFKINRFIHEKVLFRVASKEGVFTSIWRNNYWGSGESLSGPGSTLRQTENLRQKMPILFDTMGINLVFDAPCGDMHWMQHLLKNAKFSYIGGDIVNDIISVNERSFSSPHVKFIKFDITKDSFPAADVWLCRAVFYHLSNRDIYLALEQFSASNIKYILTTNCVTDEGHINTDIATGDWRSLNLNLPPFNFPPDSIWEIEDCTPPHPPMTLTLWSKSQIDAILPELRKLYRK